MGSIDCVGCPLIDDHLRRAEWNAEMKPVNQRVLNTVKGDCFAACLASLLEVPLENVPNIHDWPEGEWFYPLNERLRKEHGTVLLMVDASSYASLLWFPDGVPFIASCGVKDTTHRHAIVAAYGREGMKVLHDPLPTPDPDSLELPIYMYFLVKADHVPEQNQK
jgi:hypothetical protein